MANPNKKQVEQITDMEVDFTQWYTDVCKKAELIDYSSIKGMFIYRPYGYAIWENITKILDGMFKATGHENVMMPMLIPESLLQNGKSEGLSAMSGSKGETFFGMNKDRSLDAKLQKMTVICAVVFFVLTAVLAIFA